MMEQALLWCIAGVLFSGIVLAGGWSVQWIMNRFCKDRDAVQRDKYLNTILWRMFSGDDTCENCPPPLTRRGKRLVAEAIADLAGTTYGLDPAPFLRILKRQRLEAFLLSRARFFRGYRRAYYLQLLSRIPIGAETVRAVSRYLHSRNRYVRFYALSVQLAHNPTAVNSIVAEFVFPLSHFEFAEIILRLRQEATPVDYEPMLASDSRNLRILGLGVVWRFGVEEAEEALLRMVAGYRGVESFGALYILCALHRSITRPEVGQLVVDMPPAFRKTLLRHMARQGYSVKALQPFIFDQEKSYYASLVDSYKLRNSLTL